jgi:nitrate reductase gamma subunit
MPQAKAPRATSQSSDVAKLVRLLAVVLAGLVVVIVDTTRIRRADTTVQVHAKGGRGQARRGQGKR